jgi:hypothetical protein
MGAPRLHVVFCDTILLLAWGLPFAGTGHGPSQTNKLSEHLNGKAGCGGSHG